MQDTEPPPSPERVAQPLRDAVDRMLAPHGKRLPLGFGHALNPVPPFDISKPNQHDSKAEFLREKAVVEHCASHLDEIIGMLLAREKSSENLQMRSRLRPVIDQKFRARAPSLALDNGFTIIQRIVADAGGYIASLHILNDLRDAFDERLTELISQEAEFWNLPHRAPDYYARAIALRLARLYAQEIGQRPTLGSSGDTGEPSTDFSRALKDVFEVLGIKTAFRLPAEWALSQLSEDDLHPSKKTLVELMSGLPAAPPPRELLETLQEEDAERDRE